MTLSAHKKFLVNVVEAKEDGVLLTINGDIPVRKGELIAHNQFGEASIMPKDYYDRNYVPVKKVKKKSLFAEAYEQALGEFSLDSSFEDQDYITKTKEINNI
jgi:hypothetical protein